MERGHSLTAFAGEIGVHRDTVFEWMKAHPEFSDSVKAGQAKATAFWESILIQQAISGQGNTTAAIFGLKNRAPDDWRDKAETDHNVRVQKVERVIVKPSDSDG